MDLTELSPLYEADPPVVTIYLDTDGAVEDAAERIEVRWKDALRTLGELGVDTATLDALTASRGDHHDGGTRVLVASNGVVHLARSLPEPPAAEVLRVGPLPYLLPLVDWAQTRVPHLVVLTDREGADILAYTDAAMPAVAETVDSARHPEHKTGAGAWAALRFEHKVQNGWDASARDVAAEVEKVATDVGARLIVAAGDVHATTLLGQHLPKALVGRYTVVAGGRTRDGSDAGVAQHVLEALGDRVAADTIDLLADFAKYRNRADKQARSVQFGGHQDGVAANAAEGVAAVVAALRMAQVGTLLLTEELEEDAPLFFGPSPDLLALTPEELRDLGVTEPREGAAVDVLLRAAIGTGADVRLLPGGTDDSPQAGVGALLRYSTA